MSIAVFTSLQQLCDNAGDPLDGGSVTVYQDGTTTLIQLYNDEDLAGGHETGNPITLDAYGRHAMAYFTAQAYKVVVKDYSGATIFTRDVIDPGVPIATGVLPITGGGTGASDAATALTNLGGATTTELADLATEVATLAGTLASPEKTHIATGTTGQRPVAPIEGDIRRNTTLGVYEGYGTAAWLNFATYSVANPCPTIQALFVGSGTYTTPAGVKYIRVKMIGAGGGGGAVITNNGTDGTDTSFGSWTAIHGIGGGKGTAAVGGAGGTGGAAGTGSLVVRVNGAGGQGGTNLNSTIGGHGGASPFSGGGVNPVINSAGGAAPPNAGGGGAGGSATAGALPGAGGGAGEYVEFFVPSPAATYAYTSGARGTGGAAGTMAGGDGGDGFILVEEHYV